MHYLTFTSNCRQALQCKGLNSWFKVQAVYIPVAQTLRANQHDDGVGASGNIEPDDFKDADRLSTDVDVEKIKLFLPSQLPSLLWTTGCMYGLHGIEFKLRIAQASDTLEQLKQQLCIYSGFVHYKITQVSGPGQKANTRARNLLERLKEKITRCAERYRVSRAALEKLDPTGDWQELLRPLMTSDIQGPNGSSLDDPAPAMSRKSKRLRSNGKGVRQLSWIWRVRRQVPHSNAEPDLDKCERSFFQDRFPLNPFSSTDLRVEYAKAKARVSCWHEETLLVAEEMRCSVAFLCWKAQWWRELAANHHCIDIRRGMITYRLCQEAQFICLAEQYAKMWRPTLQEAHFDISWINNFLSGRQQHELGR